MRREALMQLLSCCPVTVWSWVRVGEATLHICGGDNPWTSLLAGCFVHRVPFKWDTFCVLLWYYLLYHLFWYFSITFCYKLSCLPFSLYFWVSVLWLMQVTNVLPLKDGPPPKYAQRVQLSTENYQVVWWNSYNWCHHITLFCLCTLAFKWISIFACFSFWNM